MWERPKHWGGFDTDFGLFYLAHRDGKPVIFENNPEWEVEYEKWGKGKKYVIFGFKLTDFEEKTESLP